MKVQQWAAMLARLRYEARIIGWLNLAAPLFAIGGFVALVALSAFDSLHNGATTATTHAESARFLSRLPEYMLPPAAGMVAAALLVDDPMRELHLSFVRAYRGTALRRLGMLSLWLAVVGGLSILALRLAGFWAAPWGFPADQLIWAAPTLAFITLGAALALTLRNRAASSAILGVVWLGEIFFAPLLLQYDTTKYTFLFLSSEAPKASYWLSNRLTLIGIASVLLIAVWALLRRNEALLGSEA